MNAQSVALYSAAQVREFDRRAIADFRIAGYELMTRAARATLDALVAAWPEARSIAVLCGTGNNGGDGLVLARLARQRGLDVRVVTLGYPAALRGDAQRAWQDYAHSGGRSTPWGPAVLDCDVVVDAMFGTGLAREIDGEARTIVEAVNARGRPVLAMDMPSGLDSDTGRPHGVAVRADLTVTYLAHKVGCHVAEGPACVGRLLLDDLGVPPAALADTDPVMRILGEDVIAAALPPRDREAHKGRFGHVLVVGGGPGMPGAALLAGTAALRAGAGLVTLAVHPSNLAAVAARPELMCVAAETPAALEAALERATVVAVGPGLGQSEWARAIHASVLASSKPQVVDADALNLLALAPQRRDDRVLTPHPGEAARLLERSTADIQARRMESAVELQSRYGGTVVLKGAGSLVVPLNGAPALCTLGNPGMATAGTGDVLTGVIAGIAAQCGDLALAAAAGVYVHARAGDLAARGGVRGMLAGDVIAELRHCVNPA
ncbi:MAG: NAD(P)H-hydrate dehydratase [Steroidobacteraceae bacterium]